MSGRPSSAPATPPVERLVGVGDVQLAVRDHAGGSPSVLCLHGLASNARWWDLVAARLAPRHRVVAVDARGHGRSQRPPGGDDVATAAADLAGVATSLGLGRVVAVGHSWGAWVALRLAAEQPAQVLGVVCVDGGVVDLKALVGPTWEVAEAAMRPPDLTGITLEALRRWVASGPLAEGSDVDTALDILVGNFEPSPGGRWQPRVDLERHLRLARDLYHVDVDALLRGVRVPVLALLATPDDPGAAGRRRREVEGRIADTGLDATVAWIHGSHDLPVQRPAEVAEAIAAFVARLETGGAPSADLPRGADPTPC